MADAELDELARAMPRTLAANARADVDLNRLKEYMDATQSNATQRMSVMVRTDVRKDAEGFEDIDDFWADDDDAANDKDDTEGEDSSMLSEGAASSANVSMLSTASEEMEVNLSGLDDDDDDGVAMNVNVNTRPRSRDNNGDTMELESLHSQQDDIETVATKKQQKQKRKAPALTLKKSRASSKSKEEQKLSSPSPPASPDFDMDGDVSYGRTSTTPPSSAKKAALLTTPTKNRSRSSSPALSSSSKAAQKKKLQLRRESREFSFGEPDGFDNVSSPFSIQDAVLTPLSNASEKNLPSIKPFSDNGSADSPNIRVELFKKSKKASADAWDGDNVTKRKKPKPSATKQKQKEPSTPKTKSRKTTYKSTPMSDMSFEDQHTDNDDGSFTANNTSGMGSDDNDSDWDKEKSVDVSRVRNGREGDLSYADEILKDSQGYDADGLRRSKRKRFKPLAWYKGEHYVYERRQSGVGLVIPTVAGIERAGTTTPLKKKPAPKKGVISRPRTTKPLPRDKLPKGLTIEDGEWADLWDISAGTMNKMNVICRSNEIEHRELPSVDDMAAGYAGQSFNLRNPSPFARWICGRLGLPPGAAKEAESVGDAVQVFFVMGCQPQSLEVAFGPAHDGFFDPKNATRFLLNPNDEFYIPAQNAYYLKNHSETATSELHFMILKPDSKAAAAAAASAASSRITTKDEQQSPESEESKPRQRKRATNPQEI